MFEDDDVYGDDDDEWPISDSDEDDRARYIAKWGHGAWDEELVQIPTSLKDNCLDCITTNFETFNYAYLSSDDSALRRNLEFLQRVYSSQVIHILSTKELLRDDHLDFLINEFSNELNTGILLYSRCSLKAIEKRIVSVGNVFTKVSFHFPYFVARDGITEFLNATICHLSNVEVLHILDCCDDKTLKNISSFCTKLSELNMEDSRKVTSEGLKMLCEGQGKCLIKILSLNNRVEFDYCAIIFLLNNMPHLEVLNYDKLSNILHYMHKEDLKNNTLNSVKKYNLTKLDFMYSDTEIKDLKCEILQVCTEVCPNIKTVSINNCTEDCLDLVSRFTNLEHFTVDSNCFRIGMRHIDLNNFLKSNSIKLRNFQIEGFALSVPILIERCSKLQNLILTRVQFQSLEKNHTKEQPFNKNSLLSLSELCLVDITFSDQHAEDSIAHVLCSTPNLRELSFDNCDFENCQMNTKLAKFCEDCGKLQHLEFFNCDAETALFESIILTCSSLLSLTIYFCQNITWEDAFNLQQLKDTVGSSVTIVYTKR